MKGWRLEYHERHDQVPRTYRQIYQDTPHSSTHRHLDGFLSGTFHNVMPGYWTIWDDKQDLRIVVMGSGKRVRIVGADLPATLLASLPGRMLSVVVDCPVFTDCRIAKVLSRPPIADKRYDRRLHCIVQMLDVFTTGPVLRRAFLPEAAFRDRENKWLIGLDELA